MSTRVRITEVAPRDGLQNEPGVIPTADKARLVQLLAAAGPDEIELTSFVSPRWVPQLADAADLVERLATAPLPAPAPVFSALVPNLKGLEGLLTANAAAGHTLITKAAVFTAASETFSQRNTNASIAQTIERFIPVVTAAHAAHLRVRGYISCVIACPFEGAIPPDAVARVADDLLRIGVDELDLGDTIGAATTDSLTELLALLQDRLGADIFSDPERFTLHLHDTFGRAADCALAAVRLGVRSFDASAAGLGGCPYASTPERPAPGNLATERLVRALHDAGYTTGVDQARLADAASLARSIVASARVRAAPATH